jgi:cytochrome c biogenesis factor
MAFFLSLKTAFWLFLLFIVILFIGSLSLPNNLAFFSGIDETPLFRWLAEAGNVPITWWIYALIVLLGVLAVSTIFCTIEALLKRMGGRQLVLKLSPQVMHIGVLFIMLGHLLTASMGFKMDVLLKQGERKAIAGTAEVALQGVKVWKDQNGYDTDWEATLEWIEGGKRTETALRPVHPRYIGMFGLYSTSVSVEPERSALIRICKDPGAVWALLGGFLLSTGGAGFLYGRAGMRELRLERQ